ncbi:OmpA family protein [Methylobacillus flagellatus]|uniref:OmpA family protein n=1 Tax=Methylobacillus flagellatus TaxID=405 RepID=UPI0028539274|nr:OmpA family protein [Methylobacillus flagellatus]MDR5172367.1 OmpA family protein [Methylobacillus flagellatus]
MSHAPHPKKWTAIIVSLSLGLQSCVTTDPKTGKPSLGETFKQTFASDDPCANNARNIGIVAGALIGGLIGNKVSGSNKALGTVIGLGVGGALGGLIGSEVDKRQCELAKIQKKYDLEMQVSPIEVQATEANVSSAAQPQQPQKVGLSVSVVDVDGKPQFQSGSAILEPDANIHFAEIARQYSLKTQLDALGSNATQRERDEVAQAFKRKRVLLIGHTDDTGSTKLNAELSEQRARAVAALFKNNGVAEEQLYYQGAGETLPIADNRTDDGRAKNRRVEIVDLSNEEVFNLYLQTRHANTAYYRPAEQAATPGKQAGSNTGVAKSGSAKTAEQAVSKSASSPVTAKDVKRVAPKTAAPGTMVASHSIDFGGVPFNSQVASLDVGEVKSPNKGLRLISEAQASDMSAIRTCDLDRPRQTGAVKSLKGDKAVATSDHLPGLYGRSWYDNVGGHLVMLNKVSVLRDGAAPANAPELKVYTRYDASKANARADVELNPAVNTYQGSNGLLYRVFAEGEAGIKCMDILWPQGSATETKGGKILYSRADRDYVVDFKPKMVNVKK